MNQTNISNTSDTITSGTTSEPWKESGAMVYVALTVATLSAVIMCCVWFIKQRINNDYGTVREDDEEEVEDDEPLYFSTTGNNTQPTEEITWLVGCAEHPAPKISILSKGA